MNFSKINQYMKKESILEVLGLDPETRIFRIDPWDYESDQLRYIHGEMRRTPDAHYVVLCYDRAISKIMVYRNRLRHNDHGPAYIYIGHFNTTIMYYKNNIQHRVDGPASIEIEKGLVFRERYRICGIMHNRVGPADRMLTTTGWDNVFYLKGHRVSLDTFVKGLNHE